MSKFLALGAGLAALALFAGACGGEGSSSNSSGRATGVAGVPDGVPLIDQDGLRFIPREVIAEAGETVYFKNSESAVHTITVDGDNISGTMSRNEVFQWTPPGVGTYSITCDFHPQMRATLEVVEELPAGTVVAAE